MARKSKGERVDEGATGAPSAGLEHTRWKIADLKSHPKQAELVGNHPPEAIQKLAQEIEKNYQAPIEILPDGTIVAGHGRTEACRLLGREDVAVIVRHDLAAKGPHHAGYIPVGTGTGAWSARTSFERNEPSRGVCGVGVPCFPGSAAQRLPLVGKELGMSGQKPKPLLLSIRANAPGQVKLRLRLRARRSTSRLPRRRQNRKPPTAPRYGRRVREPSMSQV